GGDEPQRRITLPHAEGRLILGPIWRLVGHLNKIRARGPLLWATFPAVPRESSSQSIPVPWAGDAGWEKSPRSRTPPRGRDWGEPEPPMALA
ncbi:MAG TPA: hypothetical protein VNX28_09575, partial [Gemmataceae bacterium]|nr:hypothetical protein [Gemmataceae bacterium]